MSTPLTFSAITQRGLLIVKSALAFLPENFTITISSEGYALMDDHETAIIQADDTKGFAQQVEAYLIHRGKTHG
jgi:hypothetical protein